MTIMDERNVVHPITTMPSSTLEPSTSSTLSSSSSSASVLPSMFTTTSSSQPRPASSSNVPTSSVLQDHLPYSSSHQQSPSSVIDHHPPVSVSLQFQQNSLPCSTVSSNASCTVSPSFYSSSPLLSSTLSGQPPTRYSFCGQPALSSSCAISVFPASSTSLSHLCTHTSYTIIFPTSFIVCKWASTSFLVSLHTNCPQFFTHCLPPVHQYSPAPVSRQLPLCQPSSSSTSLSLSSTTVNQPPPGQSTMPPPTSLIIVDPATLGMHATYGFPEQSCTDWLNTLKIPRNVESLDQVKEIWEAGGPNCPPLKDWTVLMRNYKSGKGQNTSVYSQRKFIYTLFQRHGFDVNPTELWSHTLGARSIYWVHISREE